MWSSFFPKENLIHLDHTLPHYIQILFIHYVLLFAEILPILNITSQNAKNALEFLKKYFCLQRAKSFATLGIFIVKWVSRDNLNIEDREPYLRNIQNFLLLPCMERFPTKENGQASEWLPQCLTIGICHVCTYA